MDTVITLHVQCKHQNYFNDVNWLKKRKLISGSLAGAIIQWYCTTLIDVLLHCTWDKKLLWTILVFTIKPSKTNQRRKTFRAAILITSMTQKRQNKASYQGENKWKKKINDPHTSFDKWTTLIYTKAVQLFQLIAHKNYSEENWLALSSHQKKKN